MAQNSESNLKTHSPCAEGSHVIDSKYFICMVVDVVCFR